MGRSPIKRSVTTWVGWAKDRQIPRGSLLVTFDNVSYDEDGQQELMDAVVDAILDQPGVKEDEDKIASVEVAWW